MATKQTIAIIGAEGKVGWAIAKRLAKEPYRLLLMGENAEKLCILQNNSLTNIPSAELYIMECPKEACWEADIIILSIPYSLEMEIAPLIKQYTTGKVVVEICLEGIENALKPKENLQSLLPNAKVVAISTINFSTAIVEDKRSNIVLEGNAYEVVKTVKNSLSTVGFEIKN